MIQRPEYLNKLVGFKDAPIIKIVTGVRRCGKSTLFELYRDHLLGSGVEPRQIHSVNFEDARYAGLLDWQTLHDHLRGNLLPEARNYIFLDEIQKVPDFQKAVDSLCLDKNVDVYLTGSNAYLFSGAIATLLSGRYIEIRMLPLSFREYLSTRDDPANLPAAFRDYLRDSSFPFVSVNRWNRGQILNYLDSLYASIILKDVVECVKIRDPLRLERIVKFLFNNIGNETSLNNIVNTMKADKQTISHADLGVYLNALIACYVLYPAHRYNVKGKQLLKTNAKYYVVDPGLRYALLGEIAGDDGHILENIVYLELLRRDYKVYVAKVGSAEVDFIAVRDGKTEYYQVSQSVLDPRTLERELAPLNAIADHNQKFLLTMDYSLSSHNGIQQRNVLEWLIGQ